MRRGQLIIAAVAFTMSCAGTWSRRDAFYGDVRCGLSVDDTRSLVERYKGEAWTCGNPSERQTDCSFRAGRTRVLIEFEGGRLRTIKDADHFGLTGMATRPKVDLCSGARWRDVLLMPQDDSWIGATIMADGKPVGTVRAGNAEYVSLPLGRYVLSIEKAGREPVKVQISVPEGTLREPPMVKLP